ncbi:efflux RND transporter permease subunit [Balneolaceae bacterium YR4-1]|uniref:Efflux RND transporter permease subunit n=1 Tax=Halalkalibaculum roseum TaxID=2709311 RepID=A0A6M1SIU0_9BACT|nr:efflux RND transporter permease subunit [Halalkalibaculum roseum]NGP75251.1 efflux RND transporter permease subunit [Halalkalibaculum roseum]
MNNQEKTNGAPHKDGKPVGKRKEFGLSSFSIDNRISVLVIIVLVALFGVQSYINIPKESSPDITIPNIMVITTYPGVSPEDMESLITRKLEDELGGISDVKTMTSTTSEGYSNINMEFNSDVNIEDALQKVREKVDLAKPELPQDSEDPIIQEINFSEFPIMQVNISGEYGLVQLKEIAEDIQDRIETIPSVLEVNLAGGLEREVKVDVDLPKLKYYGLTFADLIAAIQQENVTIPGGTIDVGTKKFLVRVPGEYETPKPIEDIVIDAPDDQPIYIRDVAEVTFGFKDRETYAELDNAPVISLSIVKRSGENILETSAAVKSILDEELPGLPPTTKFEITSDQSDQINSMVSSLENNIISGLLLVVGVLLFFLGVRNASFVGIAIPLSMFTSFIIISMLGMTMNMIVLFSLILALGMLVDNAIVVVENIYRYLEEGYDNFEAAKKGTGEVAVPIISGTLTTLAAFFPLLFWPGITGEFMSYLPMTLIITLSSSLFVALVINPVICALFMTLENVDSTGKPKMTRRGKLTMAGFFGILAIGALISDLLTWSMLIILGAILWAANRWILNPIGKWWQKEGLGKVLKRYEIGLRWALDHSKSVLGIAVLVLISSFVVFGMFNPGIEYFPEDIPPARAYVQVEAPIGTNVEFTKNIVDELEQKVPNIPNNGDIETVLSTSGSAISSNPMGGGSSSSHRGTVVLNFEDYQRRQGTSFDAIEYARSHFSKGIAGAEITVEEEQQGPPSGPPINLEISGKSMEGLTQASEDILRILENDPVYSKLDGLESDLPEARPEVRIRVDREKAAVYGLSTQAIGNTVRQAINGVEASKYRDGKDEYDITVRLDKKYRTDMSTLQDLTVVDEGRQIPLSSVATWEVTEGLGGIKHKDQERVITVMADVRSNYNANAVLEEVQQVLQPYIQNELPASYSTNWTGQQEDQQEAIDFLSMAFLVALFLISFILISQFNSLFKPFIVMTSVIMSTAGVFYGLVIFQMPFVIIMTGIGVISLAGVVVNNAIVLIDYIDILRYRDNMGLYEALVEGGKVRFRPVVLTAITTTLGLVPLAIGFNLDFIVLTSNPVEFFTSLGEYLYWGGEQAAWWAPMAIAVIVGLLFATVLTLILVPVLYYLFENGRRGINRYFFDTANPDLIVDHSKVNGEPTDKQQAEPVGAQ